MKIVALLLDLVNGKELGVMAEPGADHVPELGVDLLDIGVCDVYGDRAVLRALRGKELLIGHMIEAGAVMTALACADLLPELPGKGPLRDNLLLEFVADVPDLAAERLNRVLYVNVQLAGIGQGRLIG